MPRENSNPSNEGKAPEGAEYIESLARGLRVLHNLGAIGRPTQLSNLAEAANLPRATVRRILLTLQRGGFVETDGKLFWLTPRVLSLASAYLSSNQIVAVLQPMMDAVATETREVCSMAILDGFEAVFVARASPARVFSAGIDLGYRLPAFCSSVGRVLLGRMTNDELLRTLADAKLAPMTAYTMLDREALAARIISDRHKGYSLVDQEAEDGFRSIAVPVRRYDGAVVAAINVGSHVDRTSTSEMIDRFLPPLQRAAASAQPLLL